MRLNLLLAVPLLLGLTQIAHAQDPASCDLSALPDPAGAYSGPNLRINRATDAQTGGENFGLNDVPGCGNLLRIPPASAQARDKILAGMPVVAAKVLHATAPLTVVGNPIINGIPMEIWSGGTDKLFLLVVQKLDDEQPYSADRGALCIGVTRLPVAYQPAVKMTSRAIEWGKAMRSLASVCMKDVPRDAASGTASKALTQMVDGVLAGDDRRTVNDLAPLADVVERARLNPRPAGWPAVSGAAK